MDQPEGIPFVLKLGRALQIYGAPAHRLEAAMGELVRLMGFRGEFFSTPTAIFVSLESETEKRVDLLRITESEVDLGKLADLNEVANDVIAARMSTGEASRRIDQIIAAPPEYGAVLSFLAFAFTSSAAARFFGAGASEMLLALLTGAAVGGLAILSGRWKAISRLFDPAAGLVVSLLAVLGSALVVPASVPIVTVAGLIVLVPGLTLTLAVSELAHRNLVSGSARMQSAVIVFLMLGFGVAAGGKLGAVIIGSVPSPRPVPLPGWTEAVAVLAASVTLMILFRAHARDAGWIIATCAVTYLGVKMASPRFGPEMGVFFGALVAGAASNLYARALDRPSAVTRVPAMILLVPGGLGFLGISSLLEQNVVEGMRTAFSVAIMAVALVTGLLIANAILPSYKKL